MYLTRRAPAAMALSALAVFVIPTVWFVWIWAVVLVAFIAVDVASAPNPKHLSLTREPLPSIHLGDSTTSVLAVHNTGTRRVRGAIRDVWLPSAGAGTGPARAVTSPPGARTDQAVLDLAPGGHTTLRLELTPTRRGFRRTDQVCVRSRGPLGFAGRQQNRVVPGVVQVLPAFASRRHLPSRLVQLQEIEGTARVRTFGRGSEFDSLREYVRGDDVRSIDWRASARSRQPVVRTWRPERDRRVVIVLDTSRLAAGRLGDTLRLDAGMDACLLLAALAAHAGDSMVWLAGGRGVDTEITAERTAPGETLRRMLTAMAPLEPHLVEPDWRGLLRRVRDVARRGALVVLVSPFSPGSVEENLLPQLPALAAEYRVLLASVADPELEAMRGDHSTVPAVYDAAAAEHVVIRTEELRDVVERLGIGVLHLEADALPSALADRYLALKRDGLL